MCTFICEKGRYGSGSIHWIFLKINCRKCDVNSFTSGSHVRREIWLIKEHLFDNTVLFFTSKGTPKHDEFLTIVIMNLKIFKLVCNYVYQSPTNSAFFITLKKFYEVCKHAISTCTYNILQFSMNEKKEDKMTRLMNAVNEIWALHLNLSYNTPEGEGKKSNVGLVRTNEVGKLTDCQSPRSSAVWKVKVKVMLDRIHHLHTQSSTLQLGQAQGH